MVLGDVGVIGDIGDSNEGEEGEARGGVDRDGEVWGGGTKFMVGSGGEEQ